jgi:hypothetical protein
MADKTMPTKGPWKAARLDEMTGHESLVADVGDMIVWAEGEPENSSDETEWADAHFIAAAGTAAHECAEMGYDPIEAVRSLPGAAYLIWHLAFPGVYDGRPSDDELQQLAKTWVKSARATGKEGV